MACVHISKWTAPAFTFERTVRLDDGVMIDYRKQQCLGMSLICHSFEAQCLDITVSIRMLFNQERGGTRGEGSVVAYGYATYLALYYTHLVLLWLLVVAG